MAINVSLSNRPPLILKSNLVRVSLICCQDKQLTGTLSHYSGFLFIFCDADSVDEHIRALLSSVMQLLSVLPLLKICSIGTKTISHSDVNVHNSINV